MVVLKAALPLEFHSSYNCLGTNYGAIYIAVSNSLPSPSSRDNHHQAIWILWTNNAAISPTFLHLGARGCVTHEAERIGRSKPTSITASHLQALSTDEKVFKISNVELRNRRFTHLSQTISSDIGRKENVFRMSSSLREESRSGAWRRSRFA